MREPVDRHVPCPLLLGGSAEASGAGQPGSCPPDPPRPPVDQAWLGRPSPPVPPDPAVCSSNPVTSLWHWSIQALTIVPRDKPRRATKTTPIAGVPERATDRRRCRRAPDTSPIRRDETPLDRHPHLVAPSRPPSSLPCPISALFPNCTASSRYAGSTE
jgi:hypothetical protein